MLSGDLGLSLDDLTSAWNTVSSTVSTFATKDLPTAIQAAAIKKATDAATPYAQQIVAAKAQRVISKGNIALFTGVGILAGVLIAGGSWKRRAVGGGVAGALGALAGLKIGILTDAA